MLKSTNANNNNNNKIVLNNNKLNNQQYHPPPPPPFNLTCHPSYPSKKGSYGLWPPVVYVENDSKNPVSIRLCESRLSDTCTSEEYIKCQQIIPPHSTGILHTPQHLQFFIAVFCSLGRYDRKESVACFDFPEPLEIYPSSLAVNNTFHVPPSPETFCAGDTDCPREDYFCIPLDNGEGSICQYRACDVNCICNAILGSYGFGNKSQWIVLYVFAFSCMLITAAFILWTIRKNRKRAYEKQKSNDVTDNTTLIDSISNDNNNNSSNNNVVLPVYSKVMFSLAIIYLYDAVVWFVPPFLNLPTKDYFVFPILKIIKATIGEAVIEAVFLFLLQRGAGSTELRFSCYGGILCGLLFGLTHFIQYAKVFGIELSTITCINYGNTIVSPSCWGGVLVSAYTFAVWLLYAFTLLSPYLTIFGLKWKPPRPAIYRLMFCALVLRTVDILILFSPCFDVCSTILWSIWFQLELYGCFLADTRYWRENIKSILRTSEMLSPAPKRWSKNKKSSIKRRKGFGPRQRRRRSDEKFSYTYSNGGGNNNDGDDNGSRDSSSKIDHLFMEDDFAFYLSKESLSNNNIRSKPFRSSETIGSNDKKKDDESSVRHRRYKSVDDDLHHRRKLSSSLPNSTAILRYELLKSPIIQEIEDDDDTNNYNNNIDQKNTSLSYMPKLDLSNDEVSINSKKNMMMVTRSNTTTNKIDISLASSQHRMKLKSMDDILIDFSILKLKKIIAKGATSSVHMGYMRGDIVAIKVCSCESLTHKTISDYIREARILASFNHRNVMQMLGCCIVPPSVWIVTEHCERGNLYDVLRANCKKKKRKPSLHNNSSSSSSSYFLLEERAKGANNDNALDWNLRLYLMLGAAYGLEHIHSKRFIHGDIKPDNFIVTKDWTVKLADFGEAKEKSNQILNPKKLNAKKAGEKRIVRGEGAGTMIWLAPERLAPLYSLFVDIDNLSIPISNKSDMSQAADMYSFGLTLWEIAVGKRPFATMDTYTAGLKVLETDIRPSLEEIPSTKFTTLLKSCWVRDPKNRLDSREIVMMLESLNGGWKPGEHDDNV